MPHRTLTKEYNDQHEIERARLAELLDDLMIVIERAQKALRENRIEEINLGPVAYHDSIVQLGGLLKLRQAVTIARRVAEHAPPEVRAALI